ncbi:MAG: hypothetical protein KDI31_00670 [Pseudomonadales bacterium]|nr:hypothetical protein [Pseudomonadales bacterium]
MSRYLPEFADMRVYVGEKDREMVTEPARPITIHQLLTHTSGPHSRSLVWIVKATSAKATAFSSGSPLATMNNSWRPEPSSTICG